MKVRYKQIVLLFFFSTICLAQINSVSPGLTLGLGEIAGNSTPVTSFGGSLFLNFKLWFSEDVSFRTGFTYARKVEYFIPENRQGRYYPFIKSYWLKSFVQQKIYKQFFLEEGAGLIYLNDRTFSDINYWEPGITFNLTTGVDFNSQNRKGINLGLGIEYAMGFTKTNANYYLVYLQVIYLL